MYFGWRIVLIAAATYMLVLGTTYSAFGLFVVPVSEDFGLSRANMNTALILLNLGSAALAPVIGRLLDRFPARRIMVLAAVVFGSSLVGLGLSRSLWISAVLMAVPLAGAVLGVATLTMTVLVARWFAARRARAMLLAAMGMSLSSILVVPAVAWSIEQLGWRTTLIAAGIGATAILLALSALIRERPAPGQGDEAPLAAPTLAPGGRIAGEGEVAAAAPAAPAPLRVGALLRMPHFWFIGLGVSVAMGVSQALMISLVPLAIEDGLTLLQATSLVSAAGVAAISGKLLLAAFADRISRAVLLGGLFVLGAAMNAMLLASTGYPLLLGCAVFLGISAGAVAPLFYALLAERFGVTSFGTVRGLIAPISAGLSAVTVRLAGEVYDRTGGYELLFVIFLVAQLIAAALILASRLGGTPPIASPVV